MNGQLKKVDFPRGPGGDEGDGVEPTAELHRRLREVERDVDKLPGLIREQAAEIKGEIREGRAEAKGHREVIEAKLEPLATREYVTNRGWALLAILLAILGLLFRVWQLTPAN